MGREWPWAATRRKCATTLRRGQGKPQIQEVTRRVRAPICKRLVSSPIPHCVSSPARSNRGRTVQTRERSVETAVVRRLREWAGLIQRVGPYLLIEIVLPGGTLLALLLFLYQRR